MWCSRYTMIVDIWLSIGVIGKDLQTKDNLTVQIRCIDIQSASKDAQADGRPRLELKFTTSRKPRTFNKNIQLGKRYSHSLAQLEPAKLNYGKRLPWHTEVLSPNHHLRMKRRSSSDWSWLNTTFWPPWIRQLPYMCYLEAESSVW